MTPSSADIDKFLNTLKENARAGNYHLNPDAEFTRDLAEGLVVNQSRYGYPSCPCRLATGEKANDLDIICPCDYRDPDLEEYGCCYCALYVSAEIASGTEEASSIPERRPLDPISTNDSTPVKPLGSLSLPVYRCKVCGYLCAREKPPATCPVCKADRDRFQRFM